MTEVQTRQRLLGECGVEDIVHRRLDELRPGSIFHEVRVLAVPSGEEHASLEDIHEHGPADPKLDVPKGGFVPACVYWLMQLCCWSIFVAFDLTPKAEVTV